MFSDYRKPHHLRRFLVTLLVVLAVATAGVLSVNLMLRQQVVLERVGVTVTNLPADLEQWTILHFSDLHGQQLDRCVLYVYRLAVYYAEHETHEPEKLNWWYWKDGR